ncbi:NYN domain-containing protein, partial [Bifidobacterium adolescentis]
DQALVRRSPFDDEQLKKLADLRDHLSSKDN